MKSRLSQWSTASFMPHSMHCSGGPALIATSYVPGSSGAFGPRSRFHLQFRSEAIRRASQALKLRKAVWNEKL
jgi:hypothetical protein